MGFQVSLTFSTTIRVVQNSGCPTTGIQAGSASPMEREANMKIRIILFAAAFAIAASLLVAGCASKPVDELKMAGLAMEKARSAEAPEYAPQDWNRAQMQWQEAIALIHMGRNSEARDVLVESIASFNDAQTAAEGRIDSLKARIRDLQSGLDADLNQIERVCENPKLKTSVKKRFESALPRLDERISVMNSLVDAKEYLKAYREGEQADRYAADLEKRLGVGR